jgi:hypothetical protein
MKIPIVKEHRKNGVVSSMTAGRREADQLKTCIIFQKGIVNLPKNIP